MTTSDSAPLPASVLEALARYDTPTICNAMEIVAPERRLIGYTTKPLVCPFPELAADGRLRAHGDDPLGGQVRAAGRRTAEAAHRLLRICRHRFGPRISVIQDIDGPDVGYGAFWGEVQSSVHKALGCLGVVTDDRSATSRNGRPVSRRWPARSVPRMPGFTPTALAAKSGSPA